MPLENILSIQGFLTQVQVSVGIFAVIGALSVSRFLLSLGFTLAQAYILPGISLTRFGAGQGGWAVITGCTDGIGKEFALQLADANLNVLLVARNKEKLDDVASAIKERTKNTVETKTVVIDYSSATKRDFERLAQETSELDISILINNVGVSHDIPTPFAEESVERHRSIVDVNIHVCVCVCVCVLPGMIARNSGLIINVGSATGLVPTPYLSTYSASKAFVNTWSQALGAELSGTGIIVQSLTTFFVASKMSKIRKSSFLVPYPDTYVRSVLGKIGLSGGSMTPYTSSPYPSHALANWVVETIPTHRTALKINLDMHKDIRRRALRKLERQAAASKKE
ncbi:MAG: hypothetical protein DHS80DRAFT_26829 [Piptocephalis tieghemiana]|nr:MAG: hypothetical protein DHS80DRAFT_26829 [Piptocephalis tieghemiana]